MRQKLRGKVGIFRTSNEGMDDLLEKIHRRDKFDTEIRIEDGMYSSEDTKGS